MTYFLHRLLMFLKISWKSRKKLQPNFLVKIKVGGVEMLLWDPLLDGVRKCFPLCMCGVCMCVPHKFCLVFSQSSGFINFLFWVVIPVVSESKFHHLFYFFFKVFDNFSNLLLLGFCAVDGLTIVLFCSSFSLVLCFFLAAGSISKSLYWARQSWLAWRTVWTIAYLWRGEVLGKHSW